MHMYAPLLGCEQVGLVQKEEILLSRINLTHILLQILTPEQQWVPRIHNLHNQVATCIHASV